ncbi:MAG: class I SAM-dependent methyltransferase [Clostridiaceae bacterium]|nr:class I SAM-dependent methyltransferase [Clostridiaceae bacterium]
MKLMNKASKCGVAIDVGAGSGAFALALKDTEVFEDVIALDLSEDCVNTCKKSGLTGVKGVINDMDDNYAELICMNDLIEHVYDPLELVLECRRVIKEGGYLQIATPNGEGFDFRILKEETKNITPPEHINYFNTSSIEVLLKRAGFKEIIVETPGMLDVDIILNEIKNGLSLKNNNEYLEYLMNQDEKVLSAFQKFLSDNKLSSHMLIVAKK